MTDGFYFVRLRSGHTDVCEVHGGKLYCARSRDVDFCDVLESKCIEAPWESCKQSLPINFTINVRF